MTQEHPDAKRITGRARAVSPLVFGFGGLERMTLTPTFAIPPTFLGATLEPAAARFWVAGVPLDLGTTNRAGARAGPLAVRHASRMLVDGDNPANWRDPVHVGLADVGDFTLALGDLPASLALIEQQAARCAHLIAIGGDHTITLALLRALAPRCGPLGLVHFDAHVDTWPDNFGSFGIAGV